MKLTLYLFIFCCLLFYKEFFFSSLRYFPSAHPYSVAPHTYAVYVLFSAMQSIFHLAVWNAQITMWQKLHFFRAHSLHFCINILNRVSTALTLLSFAAGVFGVQCSNLFFSVQIHSALSKYLWNQQKIRVLSVWMKPTKIKIYNIESVHISFFVQEKHF